MCCEFVRCVRSFGKYERNDVVLCHELDVEQQLSTLYRDSTNIAQFHLIKCVVDRRCKLDARDGLLLKTDPPEQAVQAVRQVMAGQLVFPAAARRWLHQAPAPTPVAVLSERELEVLELLAAGKSNAQIAKQLHVSVNTVKFHLQKIYQSLDVSNRTEATRWFLEQASD